MGQQSPFSNFCGKTMFQKVKSLNLYLNCFIYHVMAMINFSITPKNLFRKLNHICSEFPLSGLKSPPPSPSVISPMVISLNFTGVFGNSEKSQIVQHGQGAIVGRGLSENATSEHINTKSTIHYNGQVPFKF